jgi:hypothetical protein
MEYEAGLLLMPERDECVVAVRLALFELDIDRRCNVRDLTR